jgi:hypothetical protein
VKDDDAPAGAPEMDVLKVYVWGMAAVTLVFAGLAWWWGRQEDELGKILDTARAKLPQMAQQKREILGMLQVYKTNKEDEATKFPLTWFSTIWKRKAIPEVSLQLGTWKGEVGSDGTYLEQKINVKFQAKNPLSRRQIGEFLHEIERSSTRLRVLDLTVKRSGKEDQLEVDEWTGDAWIGYRIPHVK